MIKLPIVELEKKLGHKIKRNFSCVGFDTALTTGLGIITTDDKDITIDWTLVSFESNSTNEVYIQMYKEFAKYINKSVDLVVVENVFNGLSPDVTIKLARFGTLAIAHAIENDVRFETISAVSARAKLFVVDRKKYKGKTKDAVYNYLLSIGLDVKENNSADGVLLSILGIIDGMDFRPKAEIAKAKKLKKKRITKKKKVKK